jgi:hypothetical protein
MASSPIEPAREAVGDPSLTADVFAPPYTTAMAAHTDANKWLLPRMVQAVRNGNVQGVMAAYTVLLDTRTPTPDAFDFCALVEAAVDPLCSKDMRGDMLQVLYQFTAAIPDRLPGWMEGVNGTRALALLLVRNDTVSPEAWDARVSLARLFAHYAPQLSIAFPAQRDNRALSMLDATLAIGCPALTRDVARVAVTPAHTNSVWRYTPYMAAYCKEHPAMADVVRAAQETPVTVRTKKGQEAVMKLVGGGKRGARPVKEMSHAVLYCIACQTFAGAELTEEDLHVTCMLHFEGIAVRVALARGDMHTLQLVAAQAAQDDKEVGRLVRACYTHKAAWASQVPGTKRGAVLADIGAWLHALSTQGAKRRRQTAAWGST